MKLRDEWAEIHHQSHFRAEAFLLSFLLMLIIVNRKKKSVTDLKLVQANCTCLPPLSVLQKGKDFLDRPFKTSFCFTCSLTFLGGRNRSGKDKQGQTSNLACCSSLCLGWMPLILMLGYFKFRGKIFCKANSFLFFLPFSPFPTHFSVISQWEKIKTLHFEHKDARKRKKSSRRISKCFTLPPEFFILP